MRKNLVILCFMVVWVVLTVAGLLWGFHYDWPDFVHVDYGLPLTWATNTIGTFAGFANLWDVNISNLLLDLIFWLGIMIATVAVMYCKISN
jgi:hypothetical protein